MKNGKFEIGDLVERTDCENSGVNVGDIGRIVKVFIGGWVKLDIGEVLGLHNSEYLKLVPKFNLKTQPWFIRTETPEQRIAAQEWLFEQGMAWDSGSREAFDWNFQCLTNTSSSGDKTLSFGHIPKPHKSAQEIELTYKTTVNNVVYPDIESERDKEIKAIRKEQEALAARLKALEVGS